MNLSKYLRIRLLFFRLLLALIAVTGAVSAYPAHRSLFALIGGICLAYATAMVGGGIELTKHYLREENNDDARIHDPDQ